ncbi:MAG: DUF4416 family protein [Elusimicrobia bacterium]|nr:DUF4416 family protein [Elusimicrobiota bacterium]
MGTIHVEKPVKLFAGIIAADDALLQRAKKLLAYCWGDIDTESEVVPFTFTDYYAPEMGDNLLRCWVSFPGLRSPSCLAAVKRASNDIEQSCATDGKRRMNIDPGYVTPAKVVLASTKDYSHRIYLSDGIYAEVTMMFQKGSYVFLPWTYSDYQSKAALQFFNRIRK